MTAERKHKIGFRKCTAADCDQPVHYRSKECPSCGAVQVRGDTGGTGDDAGESSSVGTTSAAPQVHKSSATMTGPTIGESVTTPVQVDGPYVVAADCHPQIDNVMAVLKRGQVVNDWSTIKKLLAAGAPIVPQNAAHGLTCCPRCQNIFAPAALIPAKQRQAG